ncbi:MAG: histidine kinase [Bacteroidota bacterium]
MQPRQEEVLHITQQQGLLSNEVSQLAVWKDTLWAITPLGISIVPIQSLKPTTDSVPVFLERITVNGQSVQLTPETTLSHSRNNMQFNFIGVAFDQPLRYQYRLLGSDTSWTETGNTSVEYGNLSPGDYQFEVKLARGTGHRVASVGFSIAPPWWNTWWFLTAAAVVLVLGVWSGFRYRVRKIKEQEAQKTAINQQLARLESQALRAQMNPHFIFNTMNAIQNYIAHNPRADAQEYLGQFARLIRQILNLSSREWVTLEEDLAALELYMELEVKRFNGRVRYELDVDPRLDRSYDRVPPLIIQPLVENAIWHGLNRKTDDGWVSISLQKAGQQIRCTVEDNGIGREAARQFGQQKNPEHRSAGLGITRERLNKLTRNTASIDVVFTDLKDASGSPSGTKVEFLIPIL